MLNPGIMLNYDHIAFDYEPFPIGMARPALDPADYGEMVRSFPRLDRFIAKDDKGVKYSLSRHNNKRGYFAHLDENPVWRRFYDFVRSEAFIDGALDMLAANGIDLGLRRPGFADRCVARFKAWRKGSPQPHFPSLRARFEFSAMPVCGGSIRPHTDHPSKVVTMVVAILEEDEWDDSLGGGTAVVRPKDVTRSYNKLNSYLDFDQVEPVRSFPFRPNQCLVFVKTYNSWHAVWPMTGNDPSKLRRTLTINIEAS